MVFTPNKTLPRHQQRVWLALRKLFHLPKNPLMPIHPQPLHQLWLELQLLILRSVYGYMQPPPSRTSIYAPQSGYRSGWSIPPPRAHLGQYIYPEYAPPVPIHQVLSAARVSSHSRPPAAVLPMSPPEASQTQTSTTMTSPSWTRQWLQSQSQMGHHSPHVYQLHPYYPPSMHHQLPNYARYLPRLYHAPHFGTLPLYPLTVCAPCCPYPSPPSHRASLPSPRHYSLMCVSSWCSVSSAAGSSVCFYFADLHKKNNCQDYYDSDRSPLHFDRVYHDIQDTECFLAWNMQAYFSHENFHLSIVYVLPGWGPLIYTVSPNANIINLTYGSCSVFLVSLD